MDVKIGLRVRGQRLPTLLIIISLALCDTGQGRTIFLSDKTEEPCTLKGCDCSLSSLGVICKDTFGAKNQQFPPSAPVLIRCICGSFDPNDFRKPQLEDIISLQTDCQQRGYHQIDLLEYCDLIPDSDTPTAFRDDRSKDIAAKTIMTSDETRDSVVFHHPGTIHSISGDDKQLALENIFRDDSERKNRTRKNQMKIRKVRQSEEYNDLDVSGENIEKKRRPRGKKAKGNSNKLKATKESNKNNSMKKPSKSNNRKKNLNKNKTVIQHGDEDMEQTVDEQTKKVVREPEQVADEADETTLQPNNSSNKKHRSNRRKRKHKSKNREKNPNKNKPVIRPGGDDMEQTVDEQTKKLRVVREPGQVTDEADDETTLRPKNSSNKKHRSNRRKRKHKSNKGRNRRPVVAAIKSKGQNKLKNKRRPNNHKKKSNNRMKTAGKYNNGTRNAKGRTRNPTDADLHEEIYDTCQCVCNKERKRENKPQNNYLKQVARRGSSADKFYEESADSCECVCTKNKMAGSRVGVSDRTSRKASDIEDKAPADRNKREANEMKDYNDADDHDDPVTVTYNKTFVRKHEQQNGVPDLADDDIIYEGEDGDYKIQRQTKSDEMLGERDRDHNCVINKQVWIIFRDPQLDGAEDAEHTNNVFEQNDDNDVHHDIKHDEGDLWQNEDEASGEGNDIQHIMKRGADGKRRRDEQNKTRIRKRNLQQDTTSGGKRNQGRQTISTAYGIKRYEPQDQRNDRRSNRKQARGGREVEHTTNSKSRNFRNRNSLSKAHVDHNENNGNDNEEVEGHEQHTRSQSLPGQDVVINYDDDENDRDSYDNEDESEYNYEKDTNYESSEGKRNQGRQSISTDIKRHRTQDQLNNWNRKQSRGGREVEDATNSKSRNFRNRNSQGKVSEDHNENKGNDQHTRSQKTPRQDVVINYDDDDDDDDGDDDDDDRDSQLNDDEYDYDEKEYNYEEDNDFDIKERVRRGRNDTGKSDKVNTKHEDTVVDADIDGGKAVDGVADKDKTVGNKTGDGNMEDDTEDDTNDNDLEKRDMEGKYPDYDAEDYDTEDDEDIKFNDLEDAFTEEYDEAGGDIETEDDLEGDMDHDMENDIAEDTDGDLGEDIGETDMENGKDEDTEGDVGEDIEGEIDQDMENDIDEDMEDADMEGEIDQDTENDMDEDTEGDVGEDIEGDIDHDMENDIAEDTEVNVGENIEGEIDQDVEIDIDEDIEGEIDQDMENDMDEDTEADEGEDIEGEIDEDMDNDRDEDTEADVGEDIEGEIDEDMYNDMDEDTEGDEDEDIEGDMDLDMEGNIDQDTEGDETIDNKYSEEDTEDNDDTSEDADTEEQIENTIVEIKSTTHSQDNLKRQNRGHQEVNTDEERIEIKGRLIHRDKTLETGQSGIRRKYKQPAEERTVKLDDSGSKLQFESQKAFDSIDDIVQHEIRDGDDTDEILDDDDDIVEREMEILNDQNDIDDILEYYQDFYTT